MALERQITAEQDSTHDDWVSKRSSVNQVKQVPPLPSHPHFTPPTHFLNFTPSSTSFSSRHLSSSGSLLSSRYLLLSLTDF
jgi:hypothetical protein